MTQPYKHAHDDESRRAPLRLAPLPRPPKREPAAEPVDPGWILEWSQPAPGDGTDA
jgi:hypothetical protein